MKILHFSDLHLDVPFTGSGLPPEVARLCRGRLRDTLHRIIDLAKERRADLVTVGGDLFEGDRVSRDTLNFVAAAFAGLAPVPVLIAPGNHDHFTPTSAYARFNWPENVHIFTKRRPVAWQFNDNLTVWGVAHTVPDERQNPLKGIQTRGGQGMHILLMHGSETGTYVENRAAHAPFRVRDVQQAGFDFALLGHYHGARMLEYEKPVGVYPGTPQPLGFGEEADGGAVLLSVKERMLECERLPTATQAFCSVKFQPDEQTTDTHALAEAVLSRVHKRARDANFLKLELTGIQPAELELDLEKLQTHLRATFDFVQVTDATQEPELLERIAQEPTVRGAFTRKLRQMLADSREDNDLVRLALRYGLDAFDGRKPLEK